MANSAYYAITASDELRDTLFFCGYKYTREKSKPRGTLTYTYTTSDFVLTISGRTIKIGDEKFRGVVDAKKRVMSFVV